MRVHPYRRLSPRDGLEAELTAVRDLDSAGECLILWESDIPCAVLPRSGPPKDFLIAPGGSKAPVLRRESGGGAVAIGPGCLNYALALCTEQRPALLDVERSYAEILNAVAANLPLPDARVVGSDLVLGDRKFGGHAQKRSRRSLLHHGTILYSFDLDLVSRLLREPARQPAYRRGRAHDRFLANAPLSLDELLTALEALATGNCAPISDQAREAFTS